MKIKKDKFKIACLLGTSEFEFVLVYDSDSFIWNYVYSVKKENHVLLKDLKNHSGIYLKRFVIYHEPGLAPNLSSFFM